MSMRSYKLHIRCKARFRVATDVDSENSSSAIRRPCSNERERIFKTDRYNAHFDEKTLIQNRCVAAQGDHQL